MKRQAMNAQISGQLSDQKPGKRAPAYRHRPTTEPHWGACPCPRASSASCSQPRCRSRLPSFVVAADPSREATAPSHCLKRSTFALNRAPTRQVVPLRSRLDPRRSEGRCGEIAHQPYPGARGCDRPAPETRLCKARRAGSARREAGLPKKRTTAASRFRRDLATTEGLLLTELWLSWVPGNSSVLLRT